MFATYRVEICRQSAPTHCTVSPSLTLDMKLPAFQIHPSLTTASAVSIVD